MSRIAELDPKDWPGELIAVAPGDTMTELEQGTLRIHAHSPAIAAALVQFGNAVRTQNSLSDRLMELVRLRIAFHNQCRRCMAIRYARATEDGVDEDIVCSLEKPMEAPDLTEAEKAAIDYGDRFATDHLSISDATYDGLRRHFSERQIVELGQWVAFCVGFGRLGATWNQLEILPEAFQEAEVAAPWMGKAGNVNLGAR